jgi:hypothetical protein
VTGLVLTVGLGETETLEAQVQDLAGNLSAVASASIIYERTPPSVLDVNWDNDPTFPYNGSVIQILFDEAMDPASFSSSNYLLQRVSDEATIPGTISLTEGNSIPNSAAQIWGLELSPNTQYKVTLGSGVTDVAGNLFGSDRTWYFSTGDATDATAPTGTLTLSDYDDAGPVRVVTLPAGSTATNNASIQIDLSAVTDDYNSRYGMKFWGDNDGSYPAFEQFASWEPFAVTKTWVLSPGAGVKYVLYKLMDSAGNESEHPGQLKIVLDDGTDVPAVSAVTIDGGATHTNDPEGKVDLDITASDEQSGLKEMWIANDAGFSTGSWEPWSPVKTEWVLPAGDGSKSVYVMVRDYLDQESPPASSPIILDLTAPEVSFAADQVITNAEVQLLEGADGTDKYRIVEPHGVGTILWEQLSGPGAVDFQDAANGDGSDEREPFVSADSEGTYFVRVTVTDQAGNVGSASSPFVWDVTPPASTLSVSANPYSTSGQPTWSWSAVTGTDFYRCSFDDFATWVDTTQTSFVPNDPLADGSHTLKVVARDLAGNQSNLSSKAVFVDTLPPVTTWPPPGGASTTTALRARLRTPTRGPPGAAWRAWSGPRSAGRPPCPSPARPARCPASQPPKTARTRFG